MRKVFLLDYADGGNIGIYSTLKKAIAAAEKSFADRNMTASQSQLIMALLTLKRSNEWTYRLLAIEAPDQYSEKHGLTIEKRVVL